MSETTVVLCSFAKCGMICESRQTVRIQKLARVLDELGRVYVDNWDCIVHLSCFLQEEVFLKPSRLTGLRLSTELSLFAEF